MKKFVLAAALVLTPLTGFSASHAADPIYGTWQTIKDDNGNSGQIKIAPCGSNICGTLVKSFDKNGKAFKSENQGKQLIMNMKADGGGKYSGGKVYSPDRDKTYKGKLQLNGNKLTVQGCVAFVCRDGGTWSRVN